MACGGIPTCVLCLLAQAVSVPFMRIRVIAALTIVLVGAVGVSAPSANATVTSPSSGCVKINSDPTYDGYYSVGPSLSNPTYEFARGETLTVRTTVFTGSSATMQLVVNGSTTTTQTTSVLGTLSHTLTEDLSSTGMGVSWGLATAVGASNATWEVECIPYTAPPSSGGSADSDSVPTFQLQLDSGVGGDCATSVSGVVGAWVDLPNLNECSSDVGRAGRSFLGWATSSDFPVEIAQRQVDNGWGAYEIFDSTGALSGVFIPRGGATLISAPAEIYAIWSDEEFLE